MTLHDNYVASGETDLPHRRLHRHWQHGHGAFLTRLIELGFSPAAEYWE